jgi:hypothetical protein
MTVPIKTFTGVSGSGLGGTNGAGTVANGGLQRDITTAFAMFNPEATRPDGQPGGIQKENLATNIWSGFLDDHIATESSLGMVTVPSEFINSAGAVRFTGMTKLHADSGWQVNSTANTNIVWGTSSADYTFTFATPFTSLSYPYIAHVFVADNSNNTNLRGTSGCAPYNMTVTGCKLQTGHKSLYTNGDGSTYYVWNTIGEYFRILLFRIV